MIDPMPPEDLPPLVPFPDLEPPSRRATDAPSKNPSLLSEAQRDEFARAAGSLDGRNMPEPAGETASAAADDFLLTADSEKSAPPSKEDHELARPVLSEQPVLDVDFLAVPAGGQGATMDAEDGFSLQNLAAALISSPQPPPAPNPPGMSDDWDFPPYLTALESASALVSGSAPITPGQSTEPTPLEPAPLAIHSSTFPSAGIPVPGTRDIAPPAAHTGDSSSRRLSHPNFPQPPGIEREPDFDEPLPFPVPSATGVHAPAAGEELSDPSDQGLGMVLSGALLIMIGMFLACRVPALAMEADALAVSSQPTADVRVGHLHGRMFLCAAGAAACLLLGIGSATLRRWAPALIHAAAWVVLLTVLACMGTATASMFYLSSNETAGDAVPGNGIVLFAAAGLLGVALPLGLIALFQRPSVSRLCALVDKKSRWTDARTVPALMVFITGVMLTVAAFALSIAHAAVPLFGEIYDSSAGIKTWAATGIVTAIAAGCAAAGKRAGWWLLLLVSAAMAISLFLTCRQHDWRHLVHLPSTAGGSTVCGMLAAAAMLPAFLILFMTRRAFLHHAAP